MPIIDLQRRFAEVGRIRAGAKNAKGHMTRLDSWRLTSANRAALEAASAIYGGDVQEWSGSPTNSQYELFTSSDSLDIMVPAGTRASVWYELWSGGGCERRCDGVLDTISGDPCECVAKQGKAGAECKPTMRLSVALPLLPGIGVWRYESHGYYAATELPQTVDFLSMAADRGTYLSGRLRLEERMSKTKKNGTRKFLVPVIDIDQTIAELASPSGAVSGGEIGSAATAGTVKAAGQIAAAVVSPASEQQKKKVWEAAKAAGLDVDGLNMVLRGLRGEADSEISDLLSEEVDDVITIIANTKGTK